MILTIETGRTNLGYIAKVKELNCYGDGNTEFEAIRDVTEVLLDILKIADKEGIVNLRK